MLSFDWDSNYEGTPGDGLSRGSIDDTIRQMIRGVRERMEREHNWGYDTENDDGTHIPGQTTVALKDDSAARAALSDMQDGAIYVEDDGAGDVKLYVYNGSTWADFTSADHADLADLDADDHDYWLKTEVLDAEDYTLDMDGNHLEVSSVPTNTLRVTDHIYDIHDITGPDAVKDDSIDETKVYRADTVSGSGEVSGNGGIVDISLPSDTIAIVGIDFECTDGEDDALRLGVRVNVSGQAQANLSLMNSKLFARDYRYVIHILRSGS
jgi:hypothetical protein